LRVLVVDDEAANVDTFRRVFRGDFEVTTALDGDSALRLLKAKEFDVVLTDYAMPGMNGLELLREATNLAPRTARLIVTAHEDLGEVRQAQSSGLAAGVVPKPWTREHILRWIDTLTRLSAMRVAVAGLRENLK
jgi:CheY-like chemotaxis protein